MQYMLIMRTTDEALAASQNVPFEEMIATMGKYNEWVQKEKRWIAEGKA